MSDREVRRRSSLAMLAEKLGLHPSIVDFSTAVETGNNFCRIPATGMADIDIKNCRYAISNMSDLLF